MNKNLKEIVNSDCDTNTDKMQKNNSEFTSSNTENGSLQIKTCFKNNCVDEITEENVENSTLTNFNLENTTLIDKLDVKTEGDLIRTDKIEIETKLRNKTDNWSDLEIKELMSVLNKEDIFSILEDQIHLTEQWFLNTCFPILENIPQTNIGKDLRALKITLESQINNIPTSKTVVNNTLYSSEFLAMIQSWEKNLYVHRSIQNINPKLSRCLICSLTVHGSIEFNLKEHVLGNTHHNYLRNKQIRGYIEKFHEVWDQMLDELYYQQIFFFPNDLYTNYCMLCQSCIPYALSDLGEHINSENHQSYIKERRDKFGKAVNTLNLYLVNISSKNTINQQPLTDDISTTKESIDLLRTRGAQLLNSKEDDNTNEILLSPTEYFVDPLMFELDPNGNNNLPKTMQILANNSYKCLICKMIAITDLAAHVHGVEHVEAYNNVFNISLVKQFHAKWKKLHNIFQQHQIYFFPLTIENQICFLCSTEIDYNKENIKSHCRKHKTLAIEGSQWLKQFDSSGPSVFRELANLLKNVQFMDVQGEMQRIKARFSKLLYDDQLLRVISDEEKKEHNFLKVGHNVYNCLLCAECYISGNDLINHRSSDIHMTRFNNEYYRVLVHKYHSNWALFSDDNQLNQIYFLPYEENVFICICCKKKPIVVKDLFKHVIDPTHITALIKMSFQTNIVPTKILNMNDLKQISPDDSRLQTLQQIDTVSYKCLLCKSIIRDIKYHVSQEMHKNLLFDQTARRVLEDYYEEWKRISPPLLYYSKYFYPISKKFISCAHCSNAVATENLIHHLHLIRIGSETNDQFTQSVYYPLEFLKRLQSIEGVMTRNIQMISEKIFRCLPCCMEVNNLEEHLATETHLTLSTDNSIIKYVQSFHAIWASVEKSFQFQQKYFYPNDENAVMCDICKIIVNKLNLVDHLKGEVVPIEENIGYNLSEDDLTDDTEDNMDDIVEENTDESDNESCSSEESYHSFNSDDVVDNPSTNNDQPLSADVERNIKLDAIWNSLSSRFHGNKKIIYWKDGILSCQLCTTALLPNKIDILTHISKRDHYSQLYRVDKRIKWRRLKYECLCCNKVIFIEGAWQDHLRSSKHNNM